MKVLKKEELKGLIRANKMKELGDVNEFIRQISKEMLETMLEEELEGHLGYERYDSENKETDNSRNGYSSKKVKGVAGEIGLEVPRDRKSEFTPVVVKKRQRDISGLEEKINLKTAVKCQKHPA
ncbi:MAG: transposase [Nitrospirae bacterium]|nr:transposase [Nitrospirota bacterium]